MIRTHVSLAGGLIVGMLLMGCDSSRESTASDAGDSPPEVKGVSADDEAAERQITRNWTAEDSSAERWGDESWISQGLKPVRDAKALTALIEIRANGSPLGTGFVIRWKERYFIVTYLPLIAGIEEVEYVLADDQRLGPLRFYAGVDNELILISIEPARNFLEPATDRVVADSIGERILVPGYHSTHRAFTSLPGRIAGLRPRTVIVLAQFEEGMSGSPVLLESGGTVVGMAAHTTKTEIVYTNELKRTDTSEWVTFRLDAELKWQELDWARFSREAREVNEAERRIYEWIAYFQGNEDPLRQRLHVEFDRFARLYQMRGVTGPIARRNRHLHLGAHALFLRDTEALEQVTTYDYNRQRQKKLAELRTQVAALILPELHQ